MRKRYTLTAGTGRDLIEAQRLTGGDPNQLALALAARLVRLDGQPVTFDEFLDWPLDDVMAVVAEVNARLGKLLSPDGGS